VSSWLNSTCCTELKCSLPCSQQPNPRHYPQPDHSCPCLYYLLQVHFNIILTSVLMSPKFPLSCRFTVTILYTFSLLSHVCHVPYPSYPPRFARPNYIRSEVQVTKPFHKNPLAVLVLKYHLYFVVSVCIIWSAYAANVVSVATFTRGCLSSDGSLCMWRHGRKFGNSVLFPIRCCSHPPCGTRWTKSMWQCWTKDDGNVRDILMSHSSSVTVDIVCFFLGVQKYSACLHCDLHTRGTKSIF
jgi:hypothetical protein